MKLDTAGWNKANSDLRKFLEATDATAPVRVVLILHTEEGEAAGERSQARPSDFFSIAEYRRALIDHRTAVVKEFTGETIEALRRLSLHLVVGEVGRAVVAEGSAAQIADALQLPGVSSAMLDRPIGLEPPRTTDDL
jgi:hypothetical protein